MMKIYNTLSRRKEKFKPLENNTVKIYVCGPTVYDHSHIGHFKTFVFFDFLVRYLREKGFKVKYVMNITDVDDKIISRANKERKTIFEYVKPYIQSFMEDIDKLHLLKPSYMPRATEHIHDIIKLIERLLEKGYAYTSDSNVYFDVLKFKDYGKLSRIKRENMPVTEEPGKRNPVDFALWKAWKPGEPYWEAPWGRGRPGWHIECSVMAMKYLGETIDIHGGGSDLIFPHHENEIAQSEAATGRQFVRYWIHVGTLNFKEEKMSKSIGNVITIKEILKKYHPDVLRLYYFSIYYRKPQNFSWEDLDNINKMYSRITRIYENLLETFEKASENSNNRKIDVIDEFERKFLDALDDDMNTPKALAVFNKFTRWLASYISESPDKKTLQRAVEFYDKFRRIAGVLEEVKRELDLGKDALQLLNIIINVRKELRKRKIFDLADYIRAELGKLGIELEDIGLETRVRYTK